VIVLDTTVLVYAKGADHPLRDPCRELISAVSVGEIDATTTAEVIQEFVHVRSRRRGRDDAAALGNDFAELLAPLLSVTSEHLRSGLRLFQATDRLGAFDAVLASAAADADTLVSADTAFADVGGLRHVVPDAAGVAHLVGGSSTQPGG
jgi:predicted nucleic acid-binding protein